MRKLGTLDVNGLTLTDTLGNGQPLPHIVEELPDFDTLMARNIRLELGEGFSKLAAGAFAIAVFEMIEANSNLNQSLQEKPIHLSVLVPEIFPDVVGFKEAPLVKVPYALMKSLIHHKATYETLV